MIGLAALAAMAAPYVLRSVVDNQATSGKALIFADRSQRLQKDLVLCLIKRPGALNLAVASNDTYTDAASDLAIKVEDRGQFRLVQAWLPQGQALGAPAQMQIQTCLKPA